MKNASYFYVLLLILQTVTGFTQTKLEPRTVNNLFNYGDTILNKQGYKPALDSLIALEKAYTQSDDPMSKSLYNQVLMTFNSFIGDNLASLKYESKSFPKRNTDVKTLSKAFQKVDAVEFILKKYGNEPLIMINEAHNRGQHRDFARHLLEKLYNKGFRYLAAEGLNGKDSLVHKRGFPIQETGYYVKEPAFGQMIRQALSLGFTLVAYEDTTAYNLKLTSVENSNNRESGQTRNILSVFQKDSTAKILVYAGHGHIEKKTTNEWVKMGERLCKAFNRDLPSIDCTAMKEGFERKDENSMFKAAIDSFPKSAPFVLTANDTAYVHPTYVGKVNVNVFFPRTNYDLGYPDWLKETNEQYYELDTPLSIKNALVQVYKAEEWSKVNQKAIPVIQLLTTDNKNKYKLFLKKGQYQAFIFEKDKVLFEKKFTVK
jgi:hypothetical protein